MANATDTYPTKATHPVDADTGGKPPCRVLLIEDDLDDQILAKKRLAASPLVESVECFSDGTELIQYLYDLGFHDRSVWCMTPMVVVLDINMPLMDGFGVLEEMKSDPFIAEIPVIVVTGTQSKSDIEKARRLKADAVFEKPLKLDKLESYLTQGWTWPRKEMWY